MKKAILLVLMGAAINFAHAKIWRVNNVPGVAADFTTAQAANDAAAAGDSIYLESSPAVYGDVITAKKLVWIGLGNLLESNPGLQFHKNVGALANIRINPGAEGSVYQISVIGAGNQYGNVEIYCADITLLRCYIISTVYVGGSANHITITQCYLNVGSGTFNTQPSTPQFAFTYTNNIIRTNQVLINQNCYQVTFNNNVLITNGNAPNNSNIIDNATISNNIFYGVSTTNLFDGSYPSNVTNNLWVSMTNPNFVGKDGNIFEATLANVFVGGASTDGQYKLAVNSPAIGAGAGNVDMGAFGGANPYVVAMIPAIPTIYQLSVPANATGNTLPCTVSTRANN